MLKLVRLILALGIVTAPAFWGGCNDSNGEDPSPSPSPTSPTPFDSGDFDQDGYTIEDGDCDDTRADVHPGALEVPYDTIDQDCSGADANDLDQDGHAGSAGGDDCDDSDPATYPGAAETPYDGIDQDCQGGDLVDVDEDGVLGGGGPDCNDQDSDIRPGATEVPYDGVDQDCSGSDLVDVDRDGYVATQANGDDCDDLDFNVHPGATEYLDSKDNNCNGEIDEQLDVHDDDGDGYSEAQGDCNDDDAQVYPGATEVAYDGIDQDCSEGDLVDVDGDGFAGLEVEGGSDCNDDDAEISPAGQELCDAVDNDCDGAVDEDPSDGSAFHADLDGDGFGNPAQSVQGCAPSSGWVADATDCDDGSESTHPGAAEVCDGLDNDCDLALDEGVTTLFYRDADGDGFGDPGSSLAACSAPAGYVGDASDCNDKNQDVHPGAAELCNSRDDDCDGSSDEGLPLTTWYRDSDGDGYGSSSTTQTCGAPPAGYVSGAGDCNDADAAIHPLALEVCDGKDNNCNGGIDEGVTTRYYQDSDGDGFGTTQASTLACTAPQGYVTDATDCKDNDASIYPGATEVCNGIDDDCDTLADEGVKTTYYRDVDGDGYGNPAVSFQACTAPAGYVTDNTDCVDSDPSKNPGASELPNGVDDNCNGQVDDGAVYSSCKTLHTGQPTLASGYYFIDPDGVSGAIPSFEVYCDMSTDGGGWTRFWWVLGDYGAVTVDPLGQDLQNCSARGTKCFARIPSTVTPTDFMVKDVNEGHHALWHFDAANAISAAVLGALRDHQSACIASSSSFWNPYSHNDSSGEGWCGNGGEGGKCDSFFYQFNGACTSFRSGSGYSMELDGDTGCYAAAFKTGVGQDGYAECASPDNNFLDDGPSDSDDKLGELYYR